MHDEQVTKLGRNWDELNCRVLPTSKRTCCSTSGAIVVYQGDGEAEIKLVLSFRYASSAELDDTPKAAAQAAGIGGKAELAIHQERSLLSDNFREAWRDPIGALLAETRPTSFQ